VSWRFCARFLLNSETGYMNPSTGFCLSFPTLFSAIAAQNQSWTTGFFASDSKIQRLIRRQHVDVTCCSDFGSLDTAESSAIVDQDSKVMDLVLSLIASSDTPDVNFIQFSQVRSTGWRILPLCLTNNRKKVLLGKSRTDSIH